MRGALEAAGLQVTWQEVEEGRANVIGRLEGAGTGKNLMFNGHMDTSNTGRETFLTGHRLQAESRPEKWNDLRPRHLQHEGCTRLLHASRESRAARRREA